MSEGLPRTSYSTEVEIPSPYFQSVQCGLVHRVRLAQRIHWSDRATWIGVIYWCRNIGSTRRGTLLDTIPAEARECVRCIAAIEAPLHQKRPRRHAG